MNTDALNTQFGIANQITFEPFEHTIIAKIQSPHATAKVALYGAHVLSFIPKQQDDLLFVSPNAIFQNGKAIRGGIPVCWPWFGAHPTDATLPSHGFARVSNWKVINTSASDDAVSIKLGLSANADTLQLWPYLFEATMEIKVGKQLSVALHTKNTDEKPFELSAALHSYFHICDINTAKLEGLAGVNYLDDVKNANGQQSEKLLGFGQRIDRRYRTTGSAIIHDHQRTINIAKSGSGITVVWNPGEALASQMGDLGESYKNMLCVEAANSLDDTVVVQPGHSHTLSTIIG
ncbi:D-hexose-6-phosphate mutarotase [Carboxylicivirga taeanensis]|uniref:D-hexose-6-phosphate mutarotase n=1 Tax=Carboxylicivirga taeanensis TaxID=1416875 RepID=UPI003F6DC72C